MDGVASITNLTQARGDVDTTGMETPHAANSRPGEENHWHAVAVVGGLAALAIVAGLINVRVSAGAGRG